MKSSAILKAVYKDCLDLGYVLIGDQLVPPAHAAAMAVVKPKRKLKVITHKTADVNDTRNINNKLEHRDQFTMLMQKEGYNCWL